MIRIFTDGSWSKNTDAGGYAALVALADGSRHVVFGGAAETSIERMELMAMLEGLRHLKAVLGASKPVSGRIPVVIVNDREDILRQISTEYDSKRNLDLWYGMRELEKDFDISVLWMERNSHPALAQVDILSANARESVEFLTPDPSMEIFTVNVALPEPIHEEEK